MNQHTCDQIRQIILDHDWTEKRLQLAEQALTHLHTCAECRQAMSDFDQLRSCLAMPTTPDQQTTSLQDTMDLPASRRVPSRPPFAKIGWMAALAASILLAAVGWTLHLREHLTPDVTEEIVVQSTLSPQDVAQHLAAFREVSNMFEHRAGWLSISDRGADMGTAERPIDHHASLLVLRLALSKSGRTVSQTDVAIVPGETASLIIPLDQHRHLRYRIWTLPGDANRLTLSVQVVSTNGKSETFSALTTELAIQPGQTLNVGSLVTPWGTYDLAMPMQQVPLFDRHS